MIIIFYIELIAFFAKMFRIPRKISAINTQLKYLSEHNDRSEFYKLICKTFIKISKHLSTYLQIITILNSVQLYIQFNTLMQVLLCILIFILVKVPILDSCLITNEVVQVTDVFRSKTINGNAYNREVFSQNRHYVNHRYERNHNRFRYKKREFPKTITWREKCYRKPRAIKTGNNLFI